MKRFYNNYGLSGILIMLICIIALAGFTVGAFSTSTEAGIGMVIFDAANVIYVLWSLRKGRQEEERQNKNQQIYDVQNQVPMKNTPVVRGPLYGRNRQIFVQQTKQNGEIAFDFVECGQVFLRGYDTWVHKFGGATLTSVDEKPLVTFHTVIKPMAAHLPFDFNKGALYDTSGSAVGRFYTTGEGFNSYKVLEAYGETIAIYDWATGGGMYKLYYKDGVQIAQLVRNAMSYNLKQSYILCVLDGYEYLQNILCMSVILFDKFEAGNQNQAFWGSSTDYHMEFSFEGIGRTKYNRDFLRLGFPNIYEMIESHKSQDVVTAKIVLTSFVVMIGIAVIITFLIAINTSSIVLGVVSLCLLLVMIVFSMGFKAIG